MRNLDEYSKLYSEEGFEDIQVKYRRKMIMEQIASYKPENILEIGCGKEPLFLYNPNISFTIVEPSSEFYEHAKFLTKKEKRDDVLCIEGEFENIVDELEKNYDMIICSCVLHEVERPAQLLEAIVKVCNERTIVHINVPNAYSLHRILAVESGLISDVHEMSERNNILQQTSVFDMESLTKLVESCGMECLCKGGYFLKPFTHGQMYQMLQSGIIDEKILDGLYCTGKKMPEMGSEIFICCKAAFK